MQCTPDMIVRDEIHSERIGSEMNRAGQSAKMHPQPIASS
jgi:hypothetical protein